MNFINSITNLMNNILFSLTLKLTNLLNSSGFATSV